MKDILRIGNKPIIIENNILQLTDSPNLVTTGDGDKYIGHFKEDAQDGVGTIYLKADKKFIKGVWETGDLVKIIKEGPYDPTNRTSQAIKRTSSKSSSAKRQVRK